jgi:hypothetical protein
VLGVCVPSLWTARVLMARRRCGGLSTRADHMPERGSVISQPPDSAEDLHEGHGAGQAAAEFGLDDADVPQHGVAHAMVAPHG